MQHVREVLSAIYHIIAPAIAGATVLI